MLIRKSDQRYTGDSYGDGNFMDVEMDKPCSDRCRCRQLGTLPGDFPFIATKDSSQLDIAFYDPTLYQEVVSVVGDAALRQGILSLETTLDGLAILAKYDQLKDHLRACPSHEEPHPAALSLSLLVNSFLTDSDIFKKFGYENLYERGYLTYKNWREFQHRQFDDDITLLDDAFSAAERNHNSFDFAAAETFPGPDGTPKEPGTNIKHNSSMEDGFRSLDVMGLAGEAAPRSGDHPSLDTTSTTHAVDDLFSPQASQSVEPPATHFLPGISERSRGEPPQAHSGDTVTKGEDSLRRCMA